MFLSKMSKILVLNLLLAGCTIGPRYECPPEMKIPEDWCHSPSDSVPLSDCDCFLWWESLNDSTLNSLMQRAANQNLDLFLAGIRILEARQERLGKSADLYPHVDASVTAGHLYYSKDALVNGILKRAINSRCIKSVDRNVNFFELGFDASWEIDLFGVTRHQLAALDAKIQSTEEVLKDRWVSLSAELARNYIELRSLQHRHQIMIKQIASQEISLNLIKQLVDIGEADRVNLLRTQNQLDSLLSEKPSLELAIKKAIHRISILTGQLPCELYEELCEAKDLPSLPCERPICFPSELIRRRPDIKIAERNLAASTELLGSAVAGLFPRFSLIGFIGNVGTQLKSLTDSASGTWLAAPQILLPIFNSKMLMQDVTLSKIQVQKALFEYQKTVIEAFEDVENALVTLSSDLQSHEAIREVQESSWIMYQLNLDLYERGIKDALEIQQGIRSLYTSEDSTLQSQTRLLLDYISLYKALGGGWQIIDCLNN